MIKALVLLYGFVAYLTFLIAALYAIGFVANFGVPKGIDDGPEATMAGALAVNLLLLAIFAVQHSVMARSGFKAWWTKVVPSSPLKKASLTGFHATAKHIAAKAVSPSSETMRTI